jgi:signal transduction histidine kinase
MHVNPLQTPIETGPAADAPSGREPTPRRRRAAAPPEDGRQYPQPRWFGVARSARTRILMSYVILLAASALVSTFLIRQILVIRLDHRVREAGQQEVLELDRLLAVGRDPETGRPFGSPRALFDAYLARNEPSNEEALITFVDGTYYRAALARFPLDQFPAEPLEDWADLATRSPKDVEAVNGTFDTEIGKGYFRVRRVILGSGVGSSVGAFVVAILPAAERDEIADLQTYGAAATLGVLILASAFAYPIAGKALAPVRLLTQTARLISRSDLTRRIEVSGAGDAAEMARSFNAMLDRLESVFQSQRAFVQDASHELRAPLTICRGHLELLGDDPEERRESLVLVIDELDRMARMVDDLQLLAETEQPDFLRPERIEIEPFANALRAKAGALATRRWMVDASDAGVVVADRHRLTEALMNLAHNAVQHTLPDDTIAIGISLTRGECRLWVRDTGAGISSSDQARVFDRFTRGRDAPRRYRGGGLGLAIVKAIAAAHDGRVELDSRLGEGSTFTIVIPRDGIEGAGAGQDTYR